MSDATRIYLARHGGTTASAADLYAGAIDPELSHEGIAQVRALARRLERVPLAAAYCSDKIRAHRTAREICESHDIKPTLTPDLREIDHGHWEGQPRKLIQEKFADEYARWTADPLTFAPRGGETGQSVLDRAMPAITNIAIAHPGKSVLVVSHTGTNRLLLCALLGIDPRRYRDRTTQDLACLNILEFRGPTEVKLFVMNDTSHYRTIG
ncbi:histidine phosphatase family protein [soil metagenome]